MVDGAGQAEAGNDSSIEEGVPDGNRSTDPERTLCDPWNGGGVEGGASAPLPVRRLRSATSARLTSAVSMPELRSAGVEELRGRSEMAATDAVISVQGLRKTYGSTEAVAGIDLHVSRGEIFAFLGPNGAGKTTTVEILEGFRRRTAGEVSVLSADPAHARGAWRDRVGVVLQESQPEPGLTVRDCLQLYAGYYSAPRDISET